MRANPSTGTVTALSTTAPIVNPTGRSWGAVAMDASGALFTIYNDDGGVFRYPISGNTTVSTRITTTFTTNFNDITMCPDALIGNIADASVIKSFQPNPVIPGELVNFTLNLANNGSNSADNVTLIDNISSQITSPEFSLDGNTYFPHGRDL